MKHIVLKEKVAPCKIIIDEIQKWASTLDPRAKGVKWLYDLSSQQRKVLGDVIATSPKSKRVSGVLRDDLVQSILTVQINREMDFIVGREEGTGRRFWLDRPLELVGNRVSTWQRQGGD